MVKISSATQISPPRAPKPCIIKASPLLRISRPEPFDLRYLSWGRRHYWDPPIAPTIHEGWHYFVVLSGNPIISINGREVQTEPGLTSIAHPDCLVGHSDRLGKACEMLTWIWRSEPVHSALRPAEADSLILKLDNHQLRRLKTFHSQCRDAVADSNERSMLQLRACRILVDLCLLEAHEHTRIPESALRIDLAIQYLRNHVGERQTVNGLCDYLQISKASLYRLFLDHTGKSPREFAQDIKMAWAREQLKGDDRSVKSVAFALGYRHAPDFSRAFKQHFGASATQVSERSEGGAGALAR